MIRELVAIPAPPFFWSIAMAEKNDDNTRDELAEVVDAAGEYLEKLFEESQHGSVDDFKAAVYCGEFGDKAKIAAEVVYAWRFYGVIGDCVTRWNNLAKTSEAASLGENEMSSNIEAITVTSLAGNMGDGWSEDAHDAYCEWLEEKLQAAYPDVDIEVISSEASGWSQEPSVVRVDGEDPSGDVAEVEATLSGLWVEWCEAAGLEYAE